MPIFVGAALAECGQRAEVLQRCVQIAGFEILSELIEIRLPLLPVSLSLLIDRRRAVGGSGITLLRAGKVYDRSLSRLLCIRRMALLAGKRGKGRLRSPQVASLQGLADGIESLGAAGLGKRFGIGEGPALPEYSQGREGLLSAVQIPTLKCAAELLKIGLTALVEALELLKYR